MTLKKRVHDLFNLLVTTPFFMGQKETPGTPLGGSVVPTETCGAGSLHSQARGRAFGVQGFAERLVAAKPSVAGWVRAWGGRRAGLRQDLREAFVVRSGSKVFLVRNRSSFCGCWLKVPLWCC